VSCFEVSRESKAVAFAELAADANNGLITAYMKHGLHDVSHLTNAEVSEPKNLGLDAVPQNPRQALRLIKRCRSTATSHSLLVVISDDHI